MGILDKLIRPNRAEQAMALNLRGIKVAKNGNYEDAQKLFEQSIALDPYLPHPRISLSNILLHDGRYSLAEAQLKEALELKPDPKTRQDALTNLASVRFHQKRYQEAVTLLEEAIRIFPADHEIYFNAGLMFEHLGMWERALDFYERSNRYSANTKAMASIQRVKQRMWTSPELTKILSSYSGFSAPYPQCSIHPNGLTEEETIKNAIPRSNSLNFFIGAGISYPQPSCIPLASQITRNIFHILYELDNDQIERIFGFNPSASEDEIFSHLCSELENEASVNSAKKYFLPFEPTFQALHDVLGSPVLRFVDLLDGGSPNLHHRMLAYALHSGCTVITPNFDRQIERAFAACFPCESLAVLVTDKDYQDALDHDRFDGVLVKIHGDMKDYNSLALTLAGTAVSCDRSIFVGDDIDPTKAKKQYTLIHPGTSLSIPKALFLQKALNRKPTVIMGYSGSDDYDLMPILNSQEFDCRGLWVSHQNHNLKAESWVSNGEERTVLTPEKIQNSQSDLSSKVSLYLLKSFGASWTGTPSINGAISISEQFKAWVNLLSLRRGDGLCCLAKLYSQRGKWMRAGQFYESALTEYANQGEHSEGDWIVTKSNIGYIFACQNKESDSLEISLALKKYIEENGKELFYSSLYSKILLDIVGVWMNTSKDNEAGVLFSKAMNIAEAAEDLQTACYGLRLAAQRYFEKEEYKQALDSFLMVQKMALDQFGDLREACISSMGAAMCLTKMGDYYGAMQLAKFAQMYAKHLGDEETIGLVENNLYWILQYFQGKSPTLSLHTQLFEAAQRDSGALEMKQLDTLMEYIETGQYDGAIEIVDNMLRKNPRIGLRSFLLFTKSNIYHRTGQWLKEISILDQFIRENNDNPLAECNLGNAYSALEKYTNAQEHLLKAIELMKGNYPLAICSLGMVYVRTNRINEAKAQLSKAEKLDSPKNSVDALRKAIEKAEGA